MIERNKKELKNNFNKIPNSIHKNFYGCPGALVIYIFFLNNSDEYLEKKGREDIIKETKLSERDYRAGIKLLQELKLVKLKKVSDGKSINTIYEFFRLPYYEIPKQAEDSCFTKEEYEEINKQKNEDLPF